MNLKLDEQDRHLITGRKVYLSAGYPTVTVDGMAARLHRLIMEPPKGYGVDHINRDKLDLRRVNLRICTQADNCLNKSLRSDNKTGVQGVWFDKARGQWAAQIARRGKRLSLGRFGSMEEAVSARKYKEKELWGAFAPL